MSNARFLSETSALDGYESGFAVIELTDEAIKTLAVRRKAFLALPGGSEVAFDVRFRSSECKLYRAVEFIKGDGSNDHADGFEMLEGMDCAALADADELAPNSNEEVEMDLCLMVIQDSGVYWQCHPSDESGLQETGIIEWRHIFDGRL